MVAAFVVLISQCDTLTTLHHEKGNLSLLTSCVAVIMLVFGIQLFFSPTYKRQQQLMFQI